MFLERGDHTFVGTLDGRPYVAPFSGNIIELCPVGALTSHRLPVPRAARGTSRTRARSARSARASATSSFTVRDERRSSACSRATTRRSTTAGCATRAAWATSRSTPTERIIAAARARRRRRCAPATWERALSDAAAGARKAGAGAAALVGGEATNEEGYLVQRLFREALGSPNVDSRARRPARSAGRRALLARPDLAARGARHRLRGRRPGARDRARSTRRRSSTCACARPCAATGRGSWWRAASRPAARPRTPRASCASRRAPPRPRSAGLSAGARRGERRPRRPRAGRAGLRAPTRSRGAAERARRQRPTGDVVISGASACPRRPRAQAVAALLARGARARRSADTADVRADRGARRAPTARGLREVGCLPDLGPGLADAPDGPAAAQIRRGAAARRCYLVPGATRCAPSGPQALGAGARLRHQRDRLRRLPHATRSRSTPTWSSPPSPTPRRRARSRIRTAASSACARRSGTPGEVRAGWQVLAELCARLDAPLPASLRPPRSSTELCRGGAVLRRPHARGDRRPRRALAGARARRSALPRACDAARHDRLEQPPELAPDGLRLGTAPSLWTGPEIEHAPSLRFLAPAAALELLSPDGRRSGSACARRRASSVSRGRRSVAAPRVASATGVPPGSVFLVAHGRQRCRLTGPARGGGARRRSAG